MVNTSRPRNSDSLFCWSNYCHAIYPALIMVEPLLSGIVLGMMPVTLAGLFVTAYLQYRRGDQLNI
jgi:cytochrome b6-f complex subunit 5